MVASSDILLRFGAAVFGVILVRDGYAGLRGQELWIQGKGRNWIFLRGQVGRVAGAFFIVLGLILLSLAWFGLS
jgi:hypothetical protein